MARDGEELLPEEHFRRKLLVHVPCALVACLAPLGAHGRGAERLPKPSAPKPEFSPRPDINGKLPSTKPTANPLGKPGGFKPSFSNPLGTLRNPLSGAGDVLSGIGNGVGGALSGVGEVAGGLAGLAGAGLNAATLLPGAMAMLTATQALDSQKKPANVVSDEMYSPQGAIIE
jgi:hypothetical protein